MKQASGRSRAAAGPEFGFRGKPGASFSAALQLRESAGTDGSPPVPSPSAALLSSSPSRYYFRNWHGMNDKEPAVYRNVPRQSDSPDEKLQGGALLDKSSFEYLFEQVTNRADGLEARLAPGGAETWVIFFLDPAGFGSALLSGSGFFSICEGFV